MSLILALPFACLASLIIYFVVTVAAGTIAGRAFLKPDNRLWLDELIKLRGIELIPLAALFFFPASGQGALWPAALVVFVLEPVLVSAISNKTLPFARALALSAVMFASTLGIVAPVTHWIFRELVHTPVNRGWC